MALKVLGLAVVVLLAVTLQCALGYAAYAQPGNIVDYTDNDYNYAFQFPSTWKLQKPPAPGEAGQVRVMVQSRRTSSYVMVLVGNVGKSITKEQFETSPNSRGAVNAMIELSIERVYKRTSQKINATSFVVNDRRELASEIGIKFYISTASVVGKTVMSVSGVHVMPFGKDYMVTFLMIAPIDPKATMENETMAGVFNSFHVLGERRLAQDLTCTSYSALDESQKFSVAYGYLEGVQAALEKDFADILVPPSERGHPMWWVLPAGLGEKPFHGLAKKLDEHCQALENRREGILTAFLSITAQKDGWPVLGISIDKSKTDPWKRILGGKDSSVSCSAFVASREETRQALVYGYYLGTEALRIRLKSAAGFSLVWPEKLSPQEVRVAVENACQKEKAGTLRDALWLTTAELAVKKQ